MSKKKKGSGKEKSDERAGPPLEAQWGDGARRSRDGELDTELWAAIITVDLGKAQELFERGADVSADLLHGVNKDRPLHWAARGGHEELGRWLLLRGANPNEKNIRGQTPLHLAAWQGSVGLTLALTQAGGLPNACDDDGSRPLHYAARAGRIESARVLIAAGADPNVRDQCLGSPLHLAAALGQTSMCVELCDLGARQGLKNSQGKTAREVALNANIINLAAQSDRADCAAALLAISEARGLEEALGSAPIARSAGRCL